MKGKGETGAVSGPTEIIAGVSQPILTYTGMAGRTMQRAVGLTVERGLAAVTGHGKEDAGLPSGVVAEGLTEKLGGGGR